MPTVPIFTIDAGTGDLAGRWRRGGGDWFGSLRRHAAATGCLRIQADESIALAGIGDTCFLLGRAGNAAAIGWLFPGAATRPALRDLAHELFIETDPLSWVGVVLARNGDGFVQVVPKHWDRTRGLRAAGKG
ncbi:MAG: hypothetical protein WAT39_23895 [Planctomycetota bacterium]